MRALITGGTGHLGSRLARLLLARGVAVRITYRPGDTTAAVADLPVEHVPADVCDAAALLPVFEGVDVVFHTAALVSFRAADAPLQWRINVDGTRNVLAAAQAAGVRRFVHTSTVNTRGIPAPGTVGDEGTPSNWQRYGLGYMNTKRAAELAVLEAAAQGFPALCVLPGTLFGPGDVHLNGAAYIQAIERWPVLAAPPGGTTVAHVDDVAEGHWLAAERGRPGACYILGGEPMSYRALYTAIAHELGRPAPRFSLPRVAFAGLGRAVGALSRYVRLPVSEGLLVAAAAPLYYRSDLAKRELGCTFRPAAEAIRDAVADYRLRSTAKG